MKRSLAIIAVCMLAAGPALAQNKHEHDADPAKAPRAAAKGMGMHEHMKLMREQMAQIRGATDPKEKERLMNEHMKTMEQSMARMQGMDCGKM